MELKKCSVCREDLPATVQYFPHDPLARSKLNSWCRECHRRYHRMNDKRAVMAQALRLLEKMGFKL
jgi:hypothetical protein